MIPSLHYRSAAAIACLLAFLAGFAPGDASAALDETRVLSLLNAQSCATAMRQRLAYVQETPSPSPAPTTSPAASPSPRPTPSLAPVLGGFTQLYATPRPTGTPVTPPPLPTPTPTPTGGAPIFLTRTTGESPPPITPAGGTPLTSPSPAPSSVPTLQPGHVAVIADTVEGIGEGKPGDATGNVHIYYAQGELVGDKAHYDGARTITVTGHPYILDSARDSLLSGDEIDFDTIAQTAVIKNARGTSAQGLERGLVHFAAKDLHSDADGVTHGKNTTVSTCENQRGGYHLTGKKVDEYPGDKLVITDAILWLGAAAVFFLPKVIIPLRQVVDQRQRPTFFPNAGYDQAEGAWVKESIGFGRNQYYYGYYQVNYFTKLGLALGYVGFFARKNGRRSGGANVLETHNRITQTQQDNIALQETENFSQRLRGNFGFNYTSNFGPLQHVPANTGLTAAFVHQGDRGSQNYSFSRNATIGQSSTESFAFTDQRQFSSRLSQGVNFTLNSSQSSFGGLAASNGSAHVNTLTTLNEPSANYTLTIDKNYSHSPSGIIDKLPELQIHPTTVFSHLPIPISPQLTIGEYAEPQDQFSTVRSDLSVNMGPALYDVYGSQLQASVNVHQFAYATGDLKAAIQQSASLTTPIGKHVVNALSYSEQNFNGPAAVPFVLLDTQSSTNTKNAQDLVRFFNGDVYNLTLGFSTSFKALAQPVSYQFAMRPSTRSYVLLGGSFSPGSGLGFSTTNLQMSTPFGKDAQLQLVTDVDWKNKARLENKTLYYSKIIGDCYEIRVAYIQSLKAINVTMDLLSFPSRAANFGIGQNGPIIPTSFNP